METNTYIPQFLECSECHRSFDLNNLKLWGNVDSKICKCCQCKKDSDIEQCKRISCGFHNRLQDDFILDIDENDIRLSNPTPDSPEMIFDTENFCSMCMSEITKDSIYNFLNIKHSFSGMTKRIKIKLCQKCFEKFKNIMNLDKVQENDNRKEMLSLLEARERMKIFLNF